MVIGVDKKTFQTIEFLASESVFELGLDHSQQSKKTIIAYNSTSAMARNLGMVIKLHSRQDK